MSHPAVTGREVDLQAHRGGLGITVENTLPAFAAALDLGVTTLECDMHVSADGVAMVLHDRRLGAEKYVDTAPAGPEDPMFPYVGGLVTELTFEQLRTLDCGSRTQPEHPGQRPVPGAVMPTLEELFALVAERGAEDVRFNVETKFDAVSPRETAPRERFAAVVADSCRRAGIVARTSIQSFDWEVLRAVRALEPRLRLTVLASPRHLAVGRPGASPWLGGVDIDDFAGDLVAAVAAEGFDAISPAHGSPVASGVGDPAYRPFATPELVASAHAAGLVVLPYTVDDPATMHALVDMGVDGLITNYPDRARKVLAERGLPLPRPYPAG